MSQSCGKIPSKEDTDHIRRSIEGHQLRYQGELGESLTSEYCVNELNLNGEFFDPVQHGYDGVYRDGTGKLVLIEAKLTVASGLKSLGNTNHGKEGSVEWVEYKATLMCDPTSTFYSPDNARIGQEILERGAKYVTFLVVHTDPNTLKTDVTKLR
jgi:hypothetical protein